jgi:hypothetical protein
MARHLGWCLLGIVGLGLSGLSGCEQSASAPVQSVPGQQVPGQAGNPAAVPGMSPAMAGPGAAGMPGAGMPGMGPTAPVAPAAEATGKSFLDLRQFLPESLQQATGIHLARLKAGGSPLSEQLRSSLGPVLGVADRMGLQAADVDLAWAGSTKDRQGVLVCLKMKSRLKEADLVKASGAQGEAEKVGKASVFDLPAHPEFKNAFAVIDGDVLLVGRRELVIEALKNPKPGPVRLGLDALEMGQVLYFVAGATLGEQIAGKSGLRTLAPLMDGRSTQVSGLAMAVLGTPGSAQSGQPFPGGAGNPAASMQGSPPMVVPPAGMAGPGMVGPGMAGPGMVAGAMPAGSANPAATTPTTTPATPKPSFDVVALDGNVKVVLAATFASEAAARAAETKVTSARKQLEDLQASIIQALSRRTTPAGANGAGPGMGAGMVPGAGPGAAGSPALPPMKLRSATDRARHPVDLAPRPVEGEFSRFDPIAQAFAPVFGQQPAGGVPAGPAVMPPEGMGAAGAGGAAGSPPGMMPGMQGMPGNTSRSTGDPQIAFELGFAVVREAQWLRLSADLSADLLRDQLGRLGDALGAAGAAAIDDGIYAGTLSQLYGPLSTFLMDSSKSELQRGLRRVSDLPVRAGYSWMTELLPYMGREDLYLKFDFAKSWSDAENLKLTHEVIPEFLNPADPRQQLRGLPFEGMGATHFVGVSGVEDSRNDVAAALPRSDPRAGMFGYDGIAKPEQVTDGQANTILMIGSGQVIGGWVHGGGATIRGARAPYFDSMSGFGSKGVTGGGAYVLMADGSARFISSSIDPQLFRAMCTTHGAETVDMSKAFPSE